MNKRGRFIKFVSIFVSLVFVFSSMVSCSGSGGSSGTELSSTEKAAATGSAAQGAIQLSGTVAASAQIADESIPAGYAPGKTGSSGTENIAKIDPRLKDVVDKMTAQLRKPSVRNTISKARSFKTMSSAPLSSVTDTTCYSITAGLVTQGTRTTYTLSATFTNCDNSDAIFGTYENLSGSITATHTVDSAGPYESSEVNANLTNTLWMNDLRVVPKETAVLNGVFTSQVTGDTVSNGTGTNMANGGFTVTTSTSHPTQPDMKLQFNFTNAIDLWSLATSGGDTTDIHTGNGSYTLGITQNVSTAPQTITLTVGLSNLQAKEVTNTVGEDLWLNGTVSIAWSPDLSQWGCLNGTYLFTTATGTPIRTLASDDCPSSGTVQVNNAIFEFGSPAYPQVTVSLVGGPSQVFPDCDLGGGMCM